MHKNDSILIDMAYLCDILIINGNSWNIQSYSPFKNDVVMRVISGPVNM